MTLESPTSEQVEMQELDPETIQVARFHYTLHELTPYTYVTYILLAANFLVFAAMLVAGVGLLEPETVDILNWGGNFGPKTLQGEWWRLSTAMFIHIGLIHLLCNMYGLYIGGLLLERLVGNSGYLVLYVVSGLCGSIASLMVNTTVVSAGASGAIFGVFGGILGFVLRGERSIPKRVISGLQNSILTIIGYNVLYGFAVEGIDNAAHFGGLFGGLVCGLLMSHRVDMNAAAGRWKRALATLAFGAVVVPLAWSAIPREHVKYFALLDELTTVEKAAMDRFNELVQQVGEETITDKEMSDAVDKDVLPPMVAWYESMLAVKSVPDSLEARKAWVMKYINYRITGWQLLVKALRSGDVSQLHNAKKIYSDKAEEVLQNPPK